MINERVISEKFSAIWKQNFPLLTPNFMRVFNEAQIKKINKKPVPSILEVRNDLISELAFNLSEIIINSKSTASVYLSDNQNLISLIDKTSKISWMLETYSNEKLNLSDSEIQETIKICNNIVEFINKTKKEVIRYRPRLKGYGFIPDLEADLTIDDTLYEIKTVNRNFKSSDLKQLFIYLALKQASDNKNWNYAGLYNPRKGVYCKFNVKSLIYNLSGGETPNESFENLLNGLVRDIQIDSKF